MDETMGEQEHLHLKGSARCTRVRHNGVHWVIIDFIYCTCADNTVSADPLCLGYTYSLTEL